MKVSLGVVGEHNILNSLSILALMDILGIDSNVVLKSLADFHGTRTDVLNIKGIVAV